MAQLSWWWCTHGLRLSGCDLFAQPSAAPARHSGQQQLSLSRPELPRDSAAALALVAGARAYVAAVLADAVGETRVFSEMD